MYVVVFGNPVDGICLRGPFVTAEDANNYAENSQEEHWVCELDKPDGEPDGCIHFLLKDCGDTLDDAANFICDEQILPCEEGGRLSEVLTEIAMNCRLAQ